MTGHLGLNPGPNPYPAVGDGSGHAEQNIPLFPMAGFQSARWMGVLHVPFQKLTGAGSAGRVTAAEGKEQSLCFGRVQYGQSRRNRERLDAVLPDELHLVPLVLGGHIRVELNPDVARAIAVGPPNFVGPRRSSKETITSRISLGLFH